MKIDETSKKGLLKGQGLLVLSIEVVRHLVQSYDLYLFLVVLKDRLYMSNMT
jgi:hypothetical protein